MSNIEINYDEEVYDWVIEWVKNQRRGTGAFYMMVTMDHENTGSIEM